MNEAASSNTVLTRELLPVANGRDDKLPPMLFVSALVWAMLILGVTFEAGVLTDDGDTVSLQVTLVADQKSTAVPDKADYISQVDQRGNGNTTEDVTPSSSASSAAAPALPADAMGPEQLKSNPGTLTDRALLTAVDSDQVLFQPDDPSESEDEVARLAQAPPAGADSSLPLPESDDPSMLIQDDNPRHLVVSVNTRRSDLAPYLSDWKNRVQRIGTQHLLNNLEANGRDGDPVISISIRPDGALEQVEILRSSGDRVLDQAALVIVNRAAPFQPLPEQIAQTKDLMRFAYKFRFRSGGVSGSLEAPVN